MEQGLRIAHRGRSDRRARHSGATGQCGSSSPWTGGFGPPCGRTTVAGRAALHGGHAAGDGAGARHPGCGSTSGMHTRGSRWGW